MPLAFNSLSHGTVAFGFFHIETQMLLLDRLFFWACDFCRVVTGLAQEQSGEVFQTEMAAFEITSPQDFGDLHGAIAGTALHGFLGALYRRWPFPRDPGRFRQKPQGAAPDEVVLAELGRYGRPRTMAVRAHAGHGTFDLGDYVFSRSGLQALVDYVWRGGMPGWQEARRPEYLEQAARILRQSDSPWFQGLDLDPGRVGFPY